MVVPLRLHVLGRLGAQDELAFVDAHEEAFLVEQLDVVPVPPEQVAVELVDVVAAGRVEAAGLEGELHVVEAHDDSVRAWKPSVGRRHVCRTWQAGRSTTAFDDWSRTMQLGMIGLGRMGANLVRRLDA